MDKFEELEKRFAELAEIDDDINSAKRPIRVKLIRKTYVVGEMKRIAGEMQSLANKSSIEL